VEYLFHHGAAVKDVFAAAYSVRSAPQGGSGPFIPSAGAMQHGSFLFAQDFGSGMISWPARRRDSTDTFGGAE
jgi:hypothetical protein